MATRTWKGTDATTPNSWSVAGNWVENSVPVTGDEVYIPSGSAAITAGLSQSSVTLNALTIQSGFSANIGSTDGALQIGVAAGTNFFVTASGGTQYIDVGSSTCDIEVYSTGSPSSGNSSFNIIGSAIDVLSVNGGSVGVGRVPGETATVTTLRILGGSVVLGDGVTLTTVDISSGAFTTNSPVTTLNVFGGSATAKQGALTTVNLYDGAFFGLSVGTITTLNVYGGRADFSASGVPRTVTTANINAYDNCALSYYPTVLTISTLNQPSRPVEVSWSV